MTADKSPYRDLRIEFFRKYFESGANYREYLTTGTAEQNAKWSNFEKAISLSADQRNTLKLFKRRMNILVMSGIWCGDCARQGPMLAAIEAACPLLSFRYHDNRRNPELQDELRINGAEKVPVVVTMSEDFFELGRFGDRHLSVYRRKVATELGVACDPGIVTGLASELEVEVGEWIVYFERLQHMLRLAPMLRKRHGD